MKLHYARAAPADTGALTELRLAYLREDHGELAAEQETALRERLGLPAERRIFVCAAV